MFSYSLLFTKAVIFAAFAVFLFDEAAQKKQRQIFWLGFVLVFFFFKEALLAYLLQRPPAPGIAPLGNYLGGLAAAFLPLLRDAAFPVEIINHYFLVWFGLEMCFAVVLQEFITGEALGVEKRQVRLSILISNTFIMLLFVVLAFSLMMYQYLPDLVPYYVWAFLWFCAQYGLIIYRVINAREEKGLRFGFIPCYRFGLLAFAAVSLLYILILFLPASALIEGIPVVFWAIFWHLQGLAVLFMAWGILARIRANTALEAEGGLLREQLAGDVKIGVINTLSPDPVYASICLRARQILNAESAALFIANDKDERLACVAVEGFFPPLEKIRIDDAATTDTLLAKFKADRIRYGKSFVGQTALKMEVFEELDNLKKNVIPQTAEKWFLVKSALAFPLLHDNKMLGVLALLNFESKGKQYPRQRKLLELLVRESGSILNQLRRYQRSFLKKQAEREYAIAHNVQDSLMLRTFPQTEGLDFCAFSIMAAQGGGDYYDIIDFGGGSFGFVCADISGKGVAAALVVVIIRSIIRSNAIPGRGAGEVVSVVNDTISSEVGEERFASLFYCQYDARSRALNYCNAGHAPLLLYRAAHKSFARLDSEGMPVGIAQDASFGEAYCGLERGDIALLFTDGLLEATDADLEQFGVERLKRVVQENKDLSARELSDKIHAVLRDFMKSDEQLDDATLLLMKVT
ncbi:MAG: PP2C family protein-serine/threonine phosphatase [Spirochaetota bacterium]|jgi:sigma-B regulation protein RsbU (phosphoserine phosphatase)|nr:PP2C family protein-serine/threonine phosphatase [Spirochaetota bacterium]